MPTIKNSFLHISFRTDLDVLVAVVTCVLTSFFKFLLLLKCKPIDICWTLRFFANLQLWFF